MDRGEMAEKLLSLTLQMISLLTGEDYMVVRQSGAEADGRSRHRGPNTTALHPLLQKRSRQQEILEITNQITELLTGEVPLRCQDVALYFSLEEWDYVDGHRDQYQDMMEGLRPHTSPDGSCRRNSLERCPAPVYSQDRLEENILENDQDEDLIDIKVEVVDEDEETDFMAEQQYELCVRNPTERCPAPLYSQDSTESHQGEDLTDVKKEDEEDQIISDQPCVSDMKDDTPGDDSIGKSSNSSEGDVALSLNCKVEEDTMLRSSGEDLIPLNLHPGFDTTDLPYNLDAPSPDQPQIVSSSKSLKGGKRFQLGDCEKNQFTQSSGLLTNKRSHTGKKTYTCLECGRCFPQKSNLVTHGRTHTGEKPFPCSECGKYFTHKSSLVVHKFIHTGERPFSCSECEKCFTHKSSLIKHERSHRGEKPFPCSLCGKCFTRRSGLNQHEKRHKGEKPYSCSECGKCFTDKSNFVTHQRIHTGEKPFTCSECGKRFTNKAHLVLHERSHTGEKPYSCPECGKCYKDKSRLVKHERIHTGEKPYSCSECGSCFTDKSGLVRHQRTHTGETF